MHARRGKTTLTPAHPHQYIRTQCLPCAHSLWPAMPPMVEYAHHVAAMVYIEEDVDLCVRGRRGCTSNTAHGARGQRSSGGDRTLWATSTSVLPPRAFSSKSARPRCFARPLPSLPRARRSRQQPQQRVARTKGMCGRGHARTSVQAPCRRRLPRAPCRSSRAVRCEGAPQGPDRTQSHAHIHSVCHRTRTQSHTDTIAHAHNRTRTHNCIYQVSTA
jgi:hypothetical protein